MVLTGTDARECLAGGRPLYNRLQHRGFNGDGRTDRASLQGVVGGRSNALTGTDAIRLDTSRPYRIQSRLVSSHSAFPQRTTRIIATRRIAIRPAHADLFDTTCG